MKDAKAGKIDFKNDEWADIKVVIGKASFGYDEFKTNLRWPKQILHGVRAQQETGEL